MSVNSFDNYPMSWKPDLSRASGPKYLALVSLLEEDIKNGSLKAGTRLPPQRELADFLDVHLSTISRAFKLCEQKGLLSSAVGNGTYVAADAAVETVLLCGKEDSRFIDMGALVPQESPNRMVNSYTRRLLKRPDALSLFSYGDPEGTDRQRNAGATWLRKSGFDTDGSHILLAAGGQNALTAALAVLAQRGGRLGTDPMTYPGIKTAARLLGVHLIPIQQENSEMTEAGVLYAVQNENIRGLYVIPDFHNPTSHVMSLETRQRIAALAEKKNILIIEDGINTLLAGSPLPPVASFAPGRTIYISSLSKTVAPGLRTAFIHVPRQYRRVLATALYTMNISVSPLLAAVSAELIEDGAADEIVRERRQELIRRNTLVCAGLNGFVTESEPSSPLRLLRLPEPFTGKSFEACAKQAGVEVYGAERFSVGGRPAERSARISVVTPASLEELAEGVRRLKKALSVL